MNRAFQSVLTLLAADVRLSRAHAEFTEERKELCMQRPEHEDYIFINEMIRKKPFYRKKWFGKLLWTAFFAVLFGLISA